MSGELKILMLEDSEEDAEIVQRLLKKERPEAVFTVAMSKDKFLQCLDEFGPDLILADNSMPQFSSSDALEIVRNRALLIPFILITGTVSEEFAARIIKQGADDYFLKDRLTRLPAAIDTALKQRRFEKEKQDAERQKEFNGNNLKALINNTNDLMWSIDRDFNLITSNDAFNKLVEINPGESVLRGTDDVAYTMMEEQLKSYKKYYERAFMGEIFTEIEYSSVPVETWLEISFYPICKADEVVGTACHSRNITERVKAIHALDAMQQQILDQRVQEQKKITRAIINAQEKERNHIGQELHDNINQILAGSKLYLSVAGKRNPGIKEALVYPIQLIDDAMNEIRLLSSHYVTPTKNINLEEIVQVLLGSLQDSLKIKTVFLYKVDNTLISDDLKLNIYRVIQEQVNNIVKHANAGTINILIETENNTVRLVIRDDGQGFDVNKKRTGVGISNMINRTESFNGKVEITSSPEEGTKVEVSIPF
ncbi:MAG: ATP-binding protein [Ferruginibacter sp.]